MRAVRWHGRYDVRVETVPSAQPPGPFDVRVAVAWCGLCGSDVLEYRSGPVQIPLEPHPVTGRVAPMVLGHEVAGWVADVGAQVTGLAAGQLVALNGLIPCGQCARCRAGEYHICPVFGHIGMSADGGLADLVTVPAATVVPAPDGLDPEISALAEPFAVAWHLIGRVGGPRARSCVVTGAGTIGLSSALILRAFDNDVAVVDVDAERLALAEELGLWALDSGTDNVPPADIVLECSGSPDGFGLACRIAEPGGVIGMAGLPPQPVPFDVSRAAHREISLVGSMSHQADADLRPALDFLADHSESAGRLITGRVQLEQTVQDGLEILAGPERGNHVKILVQVATPAAAAGR